MGVVRVSSRLECCLQGLPGQVVVDTAIEALNNMSRMVPAGTEIGNYRVIDVLGEGGMGVVLRAVHTRLGRKAAIKLLHRDYASNPDMIKRFFNEARAVNQIGHEHIVEIFDDGFLPTGEAYYVMELLPGETLGARLRRERRFELFRTIHIIAQIADALAASHTAGITHRDLKPENVFLIDR